MKNIKVLSVLSIIFTILNLTIYGQSREKADSLMNVLKTAKQDTTRVNIYCMLSSLYQNSMYDTALYYANQGLALAQKNNWEKGKTSCYYKLGIIYTKQGDHDAALSNYLKALKSAEATGDVSVICGSYNSIGLLYRAKKEFEKALGYFEKALKLSEDNNIKKVIAVSNMNIGTIYQSLAKFDEAISYYTKALKYYEEAGERSATARCNGNIAITYISQEKYDEAKKYLNKSLLFFETVADKDGIVNVLNNLTLICIGQKEYDEAVRNALKGLAIAEEINALPLEKDIYEKLTIIYDSLKNYEKAFAYQKQFMKLQDSIFNEESSRQFSEMEAKYQNEKKQKEIELLEKDKKIQASELKRQIFQKYVFIGGFVFTLILALIILLGYRKIRKQKTLINEKNAELNQQNAEIAAQRDLVTDQKNEIEVIHKELTDSIRYAERIQEAVLPGELYLKDKIKGEFFILFKPKDIVSGDFYYVEQRRNWLLIAVADCTGHGVPGAFMSMLGISFLNEIIAKDEIQTAGHVLDELRDHVIYSLQQKGITGEQKDGMDISFVAINTLTNELQFAGANNPLYIVTGCSFLVTGKLDQKPVTSNQQLIELKGDKMPVAIHDSMHNFTNHTIQLQKGDTIYLMSDGFEDQFGGPKGKKFLAKNLLQLMGDNSHKPMNEQKKILDDTIEDWKNNHGIKYEQTDDITILGIKF